MLPPQLLQGLGIAVWWFSICYDSGGTIGLPVRLPVSMTSIMTRLSKLSCSLRMFIEQRI